MPWPVQCHSSEPHAAHQSASCFLFLQCLLTEHEHDIRYDVLVSQDDLMKLPNVKEKKSQNILDAINNSKSMSLAMLIAGLGIQ